jgi:site-specific DNA recombinase
VWNRRARKTARNRDNPPESWIWSEEPAHPAIVSKREFEEVAARAAANHRTRQGPRPAKFEYLYRGILRCGICGLRMWGNHRKSSVYYSCQPSHQRATNIPAGHPPHVYLGEPPLHEAVVEFLSRGLFGSERQTYWHRRLKQSTALRAAAPAAERLKEVRAAIADLGRRIERQVANLETDDTTPALRRRIGARIAELEQQVEERRERVAALAEEAMDAPPTAADLGGALDRLPMIAERLPHLPQPEMRALFDSLHLRLTYQPAVQAVDVELSLLVDETPDRRGEVAEVWSVPPGGVGPDLRRLVRLRQRLRLRLKRSS